MSGKKRNSLKRRRSAQEGRRGAGERGSCWRLGAVSRNQKPKKSHTLHEPPCRCSLGASKDLSVPDSPPSTSGPMLCVSDGWE